ncbi:hypothetical protein EDB86DRAFT_1758912 [Lactarius hatsudake]|nr:hypothetical protein EDB86DRAFT_1758912 [Lactarius hatsudake]
MRTVCYCRLCGEPKLVFPRPSRRHDRARSISALLLPYSHVSGAEKYQNCVSFRMALPPRGVHTDIDPQHRTQTTPSPAVISRYLWIPNSISSTTVMFAAGFPCMLSRLRREPPVRLSRGDSLGCMRPDRRPRTSFDITHLCTAWKAGAHIRTARYLANLRPLYSGRRRPSALGAPLARSNLWGWELDTVHLRWVWILAHACDSSCVSDGDDVYALLEVRSSCSAPGA